MPLKADDLKSIDTYKKAIKMDAAKINASGGTKFWVYRDVELPSKQKLPVLLTLIDDTAAKALAKGKPPGCRGTCGLQEGKIAFEPAQGKVPYALLKTSIPLWTGKPLHIPAGEDVDHDAGDAAVPAPPPPPGGAPAAGPNSAQLTAGWKQLSQQANERMAAVPAQRAALTQAMAGIPEMLQSGHLPEARKHLEQLQALLKTPPPANGANPGLVKYRSALVQFAQAKTRVKAQIGGLRSALLAQLPGEKDFADNLAAELEELNDELAAVVDEAIKGAHNEASPATDAIKMKIRKYQTELASNGLIAQADSNPLGVSVTIGQTLGEALSRIRESMPA